MTFDQTETASEASGMELANAPKDASLAVRSNPDSGVQGEISQSDLRLPRINIVQKMSELAGTFKFGDVVFEKTVKLGGVDSPVPFTPLRLRKQYQQDLPFGSEVMPLIFDRVEEVRAAGGSVVRGTENYYAEIAHIQVAVPAPESTTESELEYFPYHFEGKDFALAVITVSRTAYGTLAKPIITHGFNTLRDGLYHGAFELHVDQRKSPRGTYVAPVPVFKGRHPSGLAEFFHSLIQS